MDSLCLSCANVRQVVSGKGSAFLLCQLAKNDSRFAKYPPQPIARCSGYLVEPAAPQVLGLRILSETLSICRMKGDAAVPPWVSGCFVSITRTGDELSIVCPQAQVPAGVRCEPDWRCLAVDGPLDLSLVGVIADLSDVLAEIGVSVFVISTFDTDYLLVRGRDLQVAVQALRSHGHVVRG